MTKTMPVSKRAIRTRRKRLLLSLSVGVAVVATIVVGGVLLNSSLKQASAEISFTITSPASGATVTGPTELKVALTGTELGAPADGRDHLHVSIDGGQPLALYNSPDLNLPLPPGAHTVVVELAGPNHQPLLQPQSVSFDVR